MKKVFFKGHEVKEMMFDPERNRLVHTDVSDAPVIIKTNKGGKKPYVAFKAYGLNFKFSLKHLLIEGEERVDVALFGYERNVTSCTHTEDKIMTITPHKNSNNVVCKQCGAIFSNEKINTVTEDNYLDAIHQLRLINASLFMGLTPLVLEGLSIEEVESLLKLTNEKVSGRKKKAAPFLDTLQQKKKEASNSEAQNAHINVSAQK